jgi:flagellar secretion chaperone FliS
MMLQNQQNKYLATTIQTATPGQLLIMLCDGAIRFSRLAIEALHKRQLEEAHRNLLKVQDIVKEFMSTLNPEYSISKNLMSLYEYFLHQLTQANLKKAVEPVEEVLGYLLELKETWILAARHQGQG